MKAGGETKPLGEIIQLEYGKPLDASQRKSDGLYPVYGANGEKDRSDAFFYDKPSIIVGRKGSASEVNLTEVRFWPLDVTYFVTFDETRFDLQFLYHLLCRLELPKFAKGVKPGINRNDIYAIDVAVPPLTEQQRIVTILDEAFAGIATARAAAEQNRQNARALFESHLQSVFSHAWQTGTVVSLSDLATDITDGDHMPPPKSETGVPFITIGNIQKDTRQIDFSDTFKVPREYFDGLKANKKPQAGDVLYTVTGSFGIPVLVEGSEEFCFQRHIGLVRPKASISSHWLYYLLMSPQIFKQADDGATGTAQKTVSLKLLRGFQVPRITPEQQLSDVAKLDALTAETQRLEALYQRKLEALDELKQSLLHQAFSGAL